MYVELCVCTHVWTYWKHMQRVGCIHVVVQAHWLPCAALLSGLPKWQWMVSEEACKVILFVVYLRLVTHKKIKPTAAPEGNEQLLLRCLKQCLLGGVPIVRLCSARLTARIPESQLWRRFVMWSSEKLKHVYHWLSCCFSLSHCQQDYLGAGAIIGCPSVCPRGGGAKHLLWNTCTSP